MEQLRSRKRTKAGRYTSDITFEELEQYFQLPAELACGRLGVGITVLKRTCRRFGLARWPYKRGGHLRDGQLQLPPSQQLPHPPRCLPQQSQHGFEPQGAAFCRYNSAPEPVHQVPSLPARGTPAEAQHVNAASLQRPLAVRATASGSSHHLAALHTLGLSATSCHGDPISGRASPVPGARACTAWPSRHSSGTDVDQLELAAAKEQADREHASLERTVPTAPPALVSLTNRALPSLQAAATEASAAPVPGAAAAPPGVVPRLDLGTQPPSTVASVVQLARALTTANPAAAELLARALIAQSSANFSSSQIHAASVHGAAPPDGIRAAVGCAAKLQASAAPALPCTPAVQEPAAAPLDPRVALMHKILAALEATPYAN